MKLRDLEKHLLSHGCQWEREGAGHTLWINPLTRKVAPVPRHREIKENTVRSICRQLDVPRP